MSSKRRLLFPFIFVALVAGWLVGAVALAASSSQGTASHQAAASRHRRGRNTAPVLSVTNNVISWPSQSGATGFKLATSNAPFGMTRTTTKQELGNVTSFSPPADPGATLYYGIASEGSAGVLWGTNEVSIAWPANTTTSSSSTTTTSPTSTSTTTTSPTSTSTTSSSTTTTSSTSSSGGPQPASGIAHPGGGSWVMAFDDEFNGTSVDTSKWADPPVWGPNGANGDASCSPQNAVEAGGNLTLTLASASSGACVASAPADGAGANGFTLPVGGYVEVRAELPGSGSSLYDWPAFWTADRQHWPQSGEVDFLEGLGTATANYHSSSGSGNSGTIPGSWAGAFHTFAYYRGASTISVYWDGNLVKTYTRTDDGQGEGIILYIDQGQYGGGIHPGTSVVVDYVRAWK
jgi:Glycosyl hydrolases family 16